jgi:hypothetical protein
MLSLCDYTGVMAQPWAEAGYECYCVDLQHDRVSTKDGVTYIAADILDFIPAIGEYAFVAAFPPCTDLAVSGARWFRDKGLSGLIGALQLVERCRQICEWSGAPWMLENPVSTISTYWRKPDHSFHPHDFTGFCLDDNYTKKTCLWTGGGFVMPEPNRADLPPPDDRIHKAPPSEERANFRSATPAGFARAVFEANHKQEAA